MELCLMRIKKEKLFMFHVEHQKCEKSRGDNNTTLDNKITRNEEYTINRIRLVQQTCPDQKITYPEYNIQDKKMFELINNYCG